jgi:nucleoid-associated protein YgaU
MRYLNKLIQTNSEKLRQQTTILPNVVGVSDTYIQTITVERLDTLADRFYGDATMWWVIAAANGIGKGTLRVPRGVKLRIPNITSDEVITYVTRINAIR